MAEGGDKRDRSNGRIALPTILTMAGMLAFGLGAFFNVRGDVQSVGVRVQANTDDVKDVRTRGLDNMNRIGRIETTLEVELRHFRAAIEKQGEAIEKIGDKLEARQSDRPRFRSPEPQ